ncbi:hypothetical protein PFICI_11524 [Pestalotiopsis fici W106-1]|uniref:RNA-dependent RNA polymerase n=1 Tax=Pestalotiopsis fici (strain W106-1 / CGMCC3.15140) TaxID=1229662 RepID=W3WSJ6_PESFW|nr:uncharacterized protein PFICI_11524 [Pestalotiopsis fici W106-1]ETS76137.1 hypothetical protein PFICI_11524 [Pestalotiopsis fici W106-1]
MQPITPRKDANTISFNSLLSPSFVHNSGVKPKFQEFSSKYNLQLRVPDDAELGRSPQKQRELDVQGLLHPDAKVFRRFGIHLSKKTLDSVLKTFDERARDLCKKWVRKPRGDPSVTPAITTLPKATNTRERAELRKLLDQVLQEHNPLLARRTPGPEPDETTPQPRRPSKRTSDEIVPKLPKRSKSEASISPPDDAVTAEQGVRRSERLNRPDRSFYGVSTNVSRETLVFTDNGHRVSQGTQTTIEAGSQEKARWPPAPLPISQTQDEYAISSSSLRALNESLHQIDDAQRYDNVRQYLDSSSPTHTYSDFSSLLPDHELARLEESFLESEAEKTASPAIIELQTRLNSSWPHIPPGIAKAPFAVIWEVLRALLHCKIDTGLFDLEFNDSWNNPTSLWHALQNHKAFLGKTLPEKSSKAAWDAAQANFRLHKQAVILVMTLTPSTRTTGPFFELQLHPLKIDHTHRLARRFGPDRFIEMIVPSIDPQNVPVLKKLSDEAINYARRWLCTNPHPLAGRLWKPFFVRSFRDGPVKKSSKNDWFEPEPKQVMKDRFNLFAQDGNDFRPPEEQYPEKNQSIDSHTKMSVTGLIQWLLEPSDSAKQPILKLFSRISLGLSRTEPTIVLERSQLRHIETDIVSPAGNVMNDGIGRMSPLLARKIRDSMGLTETPAGFQGRIGSAKGFWIIDVSERGDDLWIETYPSQRKWNCNFEDEDHRTFEVSSYPQLPVPASLNTQFLPILMHQAPSKQHKQALQAHLSNLLLQILNEEIEAQRIAMQDPLSCSAWVEKSSTSRRIERLEEDQIPRLGSVPRHDEDRIQFFLAAGFHPLELKMLWDMVWKLCKERCEELKRRINIKVGQSMYAYMVIDFEGILAEDEVHVSFSSSFKDELSGFADTHLHGVDVLVARSPAHFASDIQKVKAVFKPELGALKDVVVFPRRGNSSLADKLSGGDYDGDMAWVCWDPKIVDNFESAPVPEEPDLLKEGFLSKRTGKYEDLMRDHQDRATLKFLEEGFDFNMQPKFLGMCTVFKENLCYKRGSVSDSTAIRLSTMLSNLVDQGKQGIVFTNKNFAKFKKSFLKKSEPEPAAPKYKLDSWTGKGRPSHIIDFLKFEVMIPKVDAELKRLSETTQGDKAGIWDKDLAFLWDHYNKMRVDKNKRVGHGMYLLQTDIENFQKEVEKISGNESISFDVKVAHMHEKFQSIEPRGFSGTLEKIITNAHPNAKQHTEWTLLRASTYYKLYYKRSTFLWWIIGSELAALKAKASQAGPLVYLVGNFYGAMKLDPKYIKARNARREGIEDPFREDQEPYDDE